MVVLKESENQYQINFLEESLDVRKNENLHANIESLQFNSNCFDNIIPKEKILKILEAGIRAPSADNMQPWKFKLISNGFELWLNETHDVHFFDYLGMATQISCGAFLENIVLMAEANGLETSILYSYGNKFKIADIYFFSSQVRQTNNLNTLENAIENRCTNRNLFNIFKKIPEKSLAKLNNSASKDTSYQVHSYSDTKNRNAMISLLTSIDTVRYSHKHMHKDLYKVLRFNNTASQMKDGLDAKLLGIESFFFPILKILKSWKLTRISNLFGIHYLMAIRGTYLPLKTSSQIFCITHKGQANYIDFGRIMQRFWLKATNEGLSVQPLGVLPLLFARLNKSQGEGFSLNQMRKLRNAQKKFLKIMNEFDFKNDQVVMIFRLGYSENNDTKSYRRPIETYLF